MKKIFLAVLMLSAAAFAAFGQSGVIRELTGTVELKPAGADAFRAAKAGDSISQDTVVSTSFKSTAVIAVGSSLITVRPLTRLSLAEIQSSAGSETVNVSLQTGRVKVDVKPPAGTKTDLTVKSAKATASVRGTTFDFDTYNLNVSEGTVAFNGMSGASMMVRSGEASYVEADGKPANPTELASAALLPSPPVGVQAADMISDTPASESGDLSITLEY